MDKKLKLYCSLFVVTLIVMIVTNFVAFQSIRWGAGGDDKLEFVEEPVEYVIRDTLSDGGVVTKRLATVSYEVNVVPKEKTPEKVLVSTSLKQTYKVNLQKVKIEVPVSKSPIRLFIIIFDVVTIILTTIVTIWILWMVFKLIRSIRKGDIFVTQVSKYLETTGILLTVLYLYEWISSYIMTQYIINNISLADYAIVYKNECNNMYILTGLALMIISQIILLGKDLKEDQELTI